MSVQARLAIVLELCFYGIGEDFSTVDALSTDDTQKMGIIMTINSYLSTLND
jgi:hypothetical protein